LVTIVVVDDNVGDNGPNVGDFGNLRSISNRAAASSIAVVVGDSGEVEEEE